MNSGGPASLSASIARRTCNPYAAMIRSLTVVIAVLNSEIATMERQV
jgi:hypothetical protein